MIRKTLLIFVVLFIAGNLLVISFQHRLEPFRTLWQRNIIKTQDYLYNKPERSGICILGSSLSANLKEEYFSGKVDNLSLIGLSVYDGVAVLKKSGNFPDHVFIEVNHLERKASTAFHDAIFVPGLFELRRYFPLLQEKHSILNNHLIPFIYTALKAPFKSGNETKDPSKEKKNIKTTNLKVYELRKQEAIKEFSKVKPIEEERRNNFIRDIEFLKKHGCTITFFVIPMDSSLSNSPLLNNNIGYVKKNFPDYRFINLDNNHIYSTNDGKHLDEESSEYYSRFLEKTFLK